MPPLYNADPVMQGSWPNLRHGPINNVVKLDTFFPRKPGSILFGLGIGSVHANLTDEKPLLARHPGPT